MTDRRRLVGTFVLPTLLALAGTGCPAGCIALADFLSYEGEQQEALATLEPFCTPTDHRTCGLLAELDVYDEQAGAQRRERLRAACADAGYGPGDYDEGDYGGGDYDSGEYGAD